MAQPATTPKIDELRSKLKADPKSRLFYQLAEELRRAGQLVEAEQVLRTGLGFYPTYLAAWVSMGRVLRELKNDGGAIEALRTALQLDPGNVVAARLIADAYLATGERVEAIKKYKLVHALLPADEAVEAVIAQLERELNPPAPVPVSEPDDVPEATTEAPVPPVAADSMAEESLPATPAAYQPTIELAAPAWTAEPPDEPVAPAPPSFFEEADAFSPPEPAPEPSSKFDDTLPPFEESVESFGHHESWTESGAAPADDSPFPADGTRSGGDWDLGDEEPPAESSVAAAPEEATAVQASNAAFAMNEPPDAEVVAAAAPSSESDGSAFGTRAAADRKKARLEHWLGQIRRGGANRV